MNDILHKIAINAPAAEVYSALTTLPGLASWWTSTVAGESVPGKEIEFRFGEHQVRMRVERQESGKRVVWECTQAAPEWVGTRISFDLSEEAGKTTVRFGHRDWKSASDFLAHCSTKWAVFLLSLQEYAATGTGRPFPRDIAI